MIINQFLVDKLTDHKDDMKQIRDDMKIVYNQNPTHENKVN